MSVHEQKKSVRKEVLNKRDSLTIEEQISKSSFIKDRLFNMEEVKRAEKVHIFVSFGSEVKTKEIIKGLFLMGKRVIVPVVDYKNGELILSEINDFDADLFKGHYGIPEPRVIKQIDLNEIDTMILPGLAFDVKGNRLGYGAGYYDKLLEGINGNIPLIALAFEIQIVDFIPFMEYDVKIQKIITENRIIDCTSIS